MTPHADAWKKLLSHRSAAQSARIATLLKEDAARLDRLSVEMPGLFADMSKTTVTSEGLNALLSLARAAGVKEARAALFAGKRINTTESRAVLHTALRADTDAKILLDDGQDAAADARAVRARMAAFADKIRSGAWRGHTGRAITDVVNIGIGGSSLGPEMAADALAAYAAPHLRAHYVANVEASDLARVLDGLDPETTLFLVASKTFTTAETMQNARIARDWLVARHGGDTGCIARHFAALSTNVSAAAEFGIAPDNVFPFWDWVGGRYSLWSAIGLSVMILIGPERFEELLSGARAMDQHFQSAPLDKNLPVLLALIGVWHRNVMDLPSYAVIPYHRGLRRLPAWLQQVDMESNGKQAAHKTGPIVFGEPGTDAQHSFFQWLHQGTDIVPVDFIACIEPSAGEAAQQTMLLANCLAQSEALMTGQAAPGAPHRFFPGNRPSTTILLDALTPHTLGMLLALYEHKVFVQGVIWGLNSFDQFGVELGKVLAKKIESELAAGATGAHDASTTGLMQRIKDAKRKNS